MSGLTIARLEWILAVVTADGDDAPRVFVESGTFRAERTTMARWLFPIVHTIELSEPLHTRAYEIYGTIPGITFHRGDSAGIIAHLARRVDEPAVWFLDAHWFNRGDHADLPHVATGNPLPLFNELAAIAARPYADIIIVDDVHAFGNGGSALAPVSIKRILGAFGRYRSAKVIGDQYVIWR